MVAWHSADFLRHYVLFSLMLTGFDSDSPRFALLLGPLLLLPSTCFSVCFRLWSPSFLFF